MVTASGAGSKNTSGRFRLLVVASTAHLSELGFVSMSACSWAATRCRRISTLLIVSGLSAKVDRSRTT
jgi:hypothetical protein